MNTLEVDTVRLTARERDVLLLLAEGLPNDVIARRLNISASTVKAHLNHMFRAFRVTSRVQAVLAAERCGLLNSKSG